MFVRSAPFAVASSLVLATPLAAAHDEAAPPHEAADARAENASAPVEPRAADAENVEVHGEARGVDAASRVHVGRRELELRPRLRPSDLLEAVPGLVAVQHAGGGKANQYFLRGFDADHGTDIAFFVDGVPVNMPSHGHGQGFADVHFVIPELVVGVDAYKGPYFADLGDFATAGAVKFRLADSFGESVVQGTVGSFGVRRGLVIASPFVSDEWKLVLAGEAVAQDGPFVRGEALGRTNLVAKLSRELSSTESLRVTAMSYASSWRASGQLPVRAVCGEGEAAVPSPESLGQRCLDRFGYVDPSEGGVGARDALSAQYAYVDRAFQLRAQAYALRYDFRLHSNFTFFANDPVAGDGIEQTDARSVLGTRVDLTRHWHLGSRPLVVQAGIDVRRDDVDAELWRQDPRRVRLEVLNDSAIRELSSAGYVEVDARLAKAVRVVAGVRAHRVDVAVTDRIERTGVASGSGARGASLALPKLSVVVSPREDLQLFANAGRGFHSNDARASVRRDGPALLMTPAWGAEVGVRAEPAQGLKLHGAAFWLDLESELVWAGDRGTTEANAASRRIGIELGARYALSNVLFADLDATFTDATLLDAPAAARSVPIAPRRTLSAGVGARPTFGQATPFAALRVKHLADRPAMEDGSLRAEGFTVVDANVGLRYRFVEAALDVQNLFDATWREVQFATTSRLAYEPAPVSGLAMTPGWPRTFLVRLGFVTDGPRVGTP